MANNQMIYGFEKNQITPYQHGIDPGIIANSTRIDPFKLDTSVMFKAQDMMIQQQQLDLQNRKMLMDNEQFKLEQDRLNKVYDLSKRQQDFQEAKDAYADINSASKLLDIPYLSEKEKGALSQYEQDVDNIISEYEKTDDYSSAQNKIAKFQMGLLRNKEVQGAMRKANNIKALYEAWNKDPDKYDISLIQETVRKAEAGDPSVNEFSFNPGNFRVYGAAEKQKSLMNAASGIFEKKELKLLEKDADGNEYIATKVKLPDKKETYNAFYNRIVNDPIMSQSLNTDWENKKLSDKRAAELNGVPYVEDKNKKAFIDNEIGKMHSMFFDDYSAITKDNVVMTDKDYVSNPNIAGVGGSGKPTDTTLEAASLMREFNIDADSARRIASGGSRVVNINGELNWLDISNGTRTYSPTGIKVNSAPASTAFSPTTTIPLGSPAADKKRLSEPTKYYGGYVYQQGNPVESAFMNTIPSESANGSVLVKKDINNKISVGYTHMNGDKANNILRNFNGYDEKTMNANDAKNYTTISNFVNNLSAEDKQFMMQLEKETFVSTAGEVIAQFDTVPIFKGKANDGIQMFLAQTYHQSGDSGRKIISGAAQKLLKEGNKNPTSEQILKALYESRIEYLKSNKAGNTINRAMREYAFANDISSNAISFNDDGTIKSTETKASPKSSSKGNIKIVDPADSTKTINLAKRETAGEYKDKEDNIWVQTPLKGKTGKPLMRRKTYNLVDGDERIVLNLTKDGRRYVDNNMNKYWKIKEYDKGSPVFVEDGSIKDEDKVKLRKEFGIKTTTPKKSVVSEYFPE